jgi:hypothetical protein
MQGGDSGGGLEQLQEVFSQVLPGDVIGDVYLACGRSAEAAMEALLAMAGSASAEVVSGQEQLLNAATEEHGAAAGRSTAAAAVQDSGKPGAPAAATRSM